MENIKDQKVEYQEYILEDLSFKYYPVERLLIDSIDSRLNLTEKKIRRILINNVIKKGKPFNVDQISLSQLKDLNIGFKQYKRNIDSLLEKNVMVIDQDHNVNFIYPVSALPTNHKVTLADGREFCAMCAVDGMGTAFTFKQDISIKSKCSECGEEISVEIKNGKIAKSSPKEIHVLHVDLNKNQNWSGSC